MSLTVVAASLLLPSPAVAAGTTATVRSGGTGLNMRAGPSTADAQVGRLADGSGLSVVCQDYGEYVVGTQRSTPGWNRLSNGRYISDAYVGWSPARPWVHWCGPKGAALPTVRTGSGPVNVRKSASTGSARIGTLAEGTVLQVECQVWGQVVSGKMRSSAAWNKLPGDRFVADANVDWRGNSPTLPWCGQRAPTLPPANEGEFITRAVAPAQAGYQQYKVPASVTIAQAILESGWGKSMLTRRDHSYFGTKCFGNPGGIALGCRTYATTECDGKKCYSTTASFRAYRNPEGSFADHGRFLTDNPRYKNAFAYSRDPNRFATEIHKAGYATSPTYAQTLIDLMKKYNLYKYDK